jgi:hypothetical protein
MGQKPEMESEESPITEDLFKIFFPHPYRS